MAGRYSSVLVDKGRKAAVTGFTGELGEHMTVPVMAAAVAYDFKYTGKTFILVIYNALYFKTWTQTWYPL